MALIEEITQAIYNAIDEISAQAYDNMQLEKSLKTILFGKAEGLSSLGLVNLIVATEEQIQEMFGISLTLADEKAMSQKKSPFSTIEALANYIELRLQESGYEHG